MLFEKPSFMFSLLVLFAFVFVAHGAYIIIPNNTEASIGDDVTISCTSDSSDSDWFHYPVGKTIPEIVWQGDFIHEGYKERYSVVRNDKGESKLLIKKATIEDSGRFMCMETSNNPAQEHADLIVFEIFPSNTTCKSKNLCPSRCNELELFCKMRSYGNVVPSLEWQQAPGESIQSRDKEINGTTTSTVHIKIDPSKSAFYTCRVKYPTNTTSSRYLWAYIHTPEDPRSAPVDDTSKSTSTTIIVIVVIVVLVVIVFIVAFIVRKYRNRRYAGQNEEEEENGELLNGSTPTPGAIFGIGVLDETIFIVKQNHPVGCILEMYDLKPVTFKSACSFSQIINPKDLAVCKITERIFICDWKLTSNKSEIFCVNKHGSILENWSLPFEKGRITVTHDGSIVVADDRCSTIQEWELHHKDIKVITQFQVNQQHLMHAAKLADGNFVASFGDKESGNQEIRIMNSKGNILRSFKNISESKSLSVPRSLAVDKTGNIYVCDLYKKRIVLMTPELGWKEEIRTTIENEEVRGPLRACVYKSENLCQLLVADCMKEANKWADGTILVWDLSSGTAPIN